MDSDGLPMIGSGVDYTEVTAIHQKRTLAFINYFITNTASFLNNFSRAVEVRLQQCEAKIQKMEACCDILEAKLLSVPGLDDAPAAIVDKTQNISLGPDPDLAPQSIPEVPILTNEVESVGAELPQVPLVPDGMIPAKEDPTYKRFFRMVQVGVPEPAVRIKMQAEGLDPGILSNPEQLVPSSENNEDAKTQDSSGSETE